jgi:surfactin synthase thioesterase subunit/glycosyltransferase involved in cell wall biosynthesis
MRILLAQNALYYPAHGGGDRSNRLLMEALAARGNDCRVVARLPRLGAGEQERYLRELASRGISPRDAKGGVVTFSRQGVDVYTVADHPHLRGYLSAQIRAFGPAVILTSTDDPAQLLLEASLRAGVPTVYLARTTLALPFGPDSAFPSPPKTEALRQARAVIGVSHYVAQYIRTWSRIPAVHVPISPLDPPPYPALGRFDNEFVTLVNPCAVKGIAIFLELAGRLPGVRFLGVPTWGTNQADRAALAGHSNVTVVEASDNVDDILGRTRVLLVPSLWAEARSRIVVEAMLRGVPVIASHVGGIPEAKLGVDYLLPVRPIRKYEPQLDEQMVPRAEVPPQDIAPWQATLERLLADRAHYQALSAASRQAALSYAEELSVRPVEALLEDVTRPCGNRITVAAALPPPARDHLSAERRQLLALRLRKISGIPPGSLRLFCFPHAGGSAGTFQGWAEQLPHTISVTPIRAPRRHDMAELVAWLADKMEPYLDAPFAFFGHSMGAVVAFELARLLRRCQKPLPSVLAVSGARAPQCRRGHVPPPDPSEAEFVRELRRLEGMPQEVFSDPALLHAILPAVRADAAIYRRYVYAEEPPLDCPIRAYGGVDDPHVRREHLEAWVEQTTATFAVRLFPGGHFYLQTARPRLLHALARDLPVST